MKDMDLIGVCIHETVKHLVYDYPYALTGEIPHSLEFLFLYFRQSMKVR